jgi:TDG/mug DNA glycosylase family protein
VGINPGLYSGAVGHHFARPGNRFWPVLQRAGFTPEIVSPFAEHELLALGIGITNLVARATASAAELSTGELAAGARRLERKLHRYRPAFAAFLGLSAYRLARGRPRAALGEQPETIGDTRLWLLPNPSGLNAHYQRSELTRVFADLRRATLTPAVPRAPRRSP